MTAKLTINVMFLAACLATVLMLLSVRTVAADRDGDRLLAAVAAGLLTYGLLDRDGYRSYGYGYAAPAYDPRYYGSYPNPGNYDYRRGPWRYDDNYRPWSWGNTDRYRFGYERPPTIYYTPRSYGRSDRDRDRDDWAWRGSGRR